MKNILRSTLCIVFALSMMVTLVVSASADETNTFEEYIRFSGEAQGDIVPAIASNGDFEFEIQFQVESEKFIATSNTMTIWTKAYLYSAADGQNHYDIDRKYTITLMKDGWLWDSEVGTLTAYSDWMEYSQTFSVDQDKTYYIRVTVTTSLVSTSYTMIGHGNVSNMELK